MNRLFRTAFLTALLLAAAVLPAAAADGDGVPYRGRLDLTVTDSSMDGDILVVTGVLDGNAAHLDPLTAVGTFTFVGGTGRFEHAAGDGDFAATSRR